MTLIRPEGPFASDVIIYFDSRYVEERLHDCRFQCRRSTNVMEGQAVEDDGYSDDDLDALPDHAFHELQEDAVRSTQQPGPQLPALRQAPKPDRPGLAGGFGRLSVTGPSVNAKTHHSHQPPSSDYGDFEDEMLDGEIFDAAEQPVLAARYDASVIDTGPGESTQREQWRRQRYGRPASGPRIPHLREEQAARIPVRNLAGTKENYNDVQGDGALRPGSGYTINQQPIQGAVDVDALQVQVQKVCLPSNIMRRDFRS